MSQVASYIAQALRLRRDHEAAWDALGSPALTREQRAFSRVEWRRCVIAPAVKATLKADANAGRGHMRTVELVEALWPEALARGDDIPLRRWLFPILGQLAQDAVMEGWFVLGEPSRHFSGRMIRPKLWCVPVPQPADVGFRAG